MSGISVHGLRFRVQRSPKRRTTAICIERDGELVVQAPDASTDAELAAVAEAKLPWVHRKLAERLLRADLPAKEFVAGERFEYLGRSYRLAFTETDRVALRHGRLEAPASEREHAEALLRKWYLKRGRAWLPARLAPWSERMGIVHPITIKVRDLGYRWASMSPSESLNVHWQTMSLSPNVIDYLLVHELAHIEHPSHDKEFWRTVSRTMPDAEQRREWLRRHGRGW